MIFSMALGGQQLGNVLFLLQYLLKNKERSLFICEETKIYNNTDDYVEATTDFKTM